jgi:hypothetical protein
VERIYVVYTVVYMLPCLVLIRQKPRKPLIWKMGEKKVDIWMFPFVGKDKFGNRVVNPAILNDLGMPCRKQTWLSRWSPRMAGVILSAMSSVRSVREAPQQELDPAISVTCHLTCDLPCHAHQKTTLG